MIDAIEANRLIDGWTMAERQIIQAELTKLAVGNIKLDDATGTWALSLSGQVEPRATGAIMMRSYVSMKAKRLVILKPSYEHAETEYVEARLERKWTWRGPRTTTIEPSRSITHTTIRTVPRSAWRVRSLFFGADAQFPYEQSISGDLFGPDGKLSFDGDGFQGQIMCGIDVTMVVENMTNQRLPFNAVMIGVAYPKKTNRVGGVAPAADGPEK